MVVDKEWPGMQPGQVKRKVPVGTHRGLDSKQTLAANTIYGTMRRLPQESLKAFRCQVMRRTDAPDQFVRSSPPSTPPVWRRKAPKRRAGAAAL